uniref:Arpin n=1 Tax=Arion vulgaris TaxID=1028688 RepID=A0A0B7A763_9EUPU
MSRVYDNKPLANLPVHNVKWNGTWNHNEWTNAKKEQSGVIFEGKVLSQARISITSLPESAAPKARYYLLFTKITKAHRRKFDANLTEVEPNFSETSKVSTGHLNSSYEVKAKGKTDKLSVEEVKTLITNAKVSTMISEIVEKFSEEDVTLLMREEDRNKLELFNDVLVRVKTAGNNPFVESLIIRDDMNSATAGNFVGDDKVGGNWTNKIMAVKSSLGEEGSSKEKSEIGDDEWDD